MGLFGRRKPGFSKEVELKPEDIPGEFSDALDDAVNKNSNPKTEKLYLAKMADAAIQGEPMPENPDVQPKVDIFDLMESMPDVQDPFPPSEPEEEPAPAPQKTDAQLLADFIRHRSSGALLTAYKMLAKEEEHLDELIAQLRADESCADIRSIKGQKDEYFYSEEVMANNYAMIAMLVEEKDLAQTVIEMVRFNAKTYPSPTPFYYFGRSPYNYTPQQVRLAADQAMRRPEAEDIQELVTYNGVHYLYSLKHMSKRYAQALADSAETQEGDE